MSRLKKALCLFLSVVFLFQLLPVTALAADGDASYTNESFQPVDMSDAVAADEIAVLGEDTSLREEFTKQYTLENGAKMAVVYPSAVHYEENGAWQDIDNRLNETTASYTVAAHAGVPTGAVVSEEQGGDSVELSRGQAVFVSAAERRVWAYGTGSFVQVAAP